MTSRGWALVGLGAAGLVAGAVPLALALSTPEGHNRELIAVFGPLIGWAFIGTGLFATLRRPQNRFGALMIAAGFAYCVSSLTVATDPWLFTVGLLFIPLAYAILFHILLAFPTGTLGSRFERLLVVVGYCSATVAHWAAVLFQDPTRQGRPANPLLVANEPSVASLVYRGRYALGLLLIAALLVILARRWRAASGSQRRASRRCWHPAVS